MFSIKGWRVWWGKICQQKCSQVQESVEAWIRMNLSCSEMAGPDVSQPEALEVQHFTICTGEWDLFSIREEKGCFYSVLREMWGHESEV